MKNYGAVDALFATISDLENGQERVAEHFGFSSFQLLRESIERNPASYRKGFFAELEAFKQYVSLDQPI